MKPSYEELAAQVEVLRIDGEAIEGCLAWLSEHEQTIDVGVGHIQSTAGFLTKYLKTMQSATSAACLAQVRAESEQSGFVAGWKRRSALGPLRKMWSEDEILEIAKEHANRIRQEVK